MARVVLVDLLHPHCPQYSRCVERRVSRLQEVIGNSAEEPVYLLLHQHTPRSGETESLSEAAVLDRFVRLNRRVHVVINRSAAASLYSFKQAADALDATDVQVLTCSRRQAVLQVYQELLFTPVYSFHYRTVFNDLHCPLDDLALTCSQRAEVKDEISTFLQRLPAVKGEITILKSSMISDCFSHGFTTRTGGISYISTLSSLNLFSSSRRRDSSAVVAENLRRLGLQAGFQPNQFHLAKVNHASDVWVMSKPAPESYDAIVTNQPGIVIAAPGADCMPLLFTDPVAKVIGAAHAGWRGTLMGIAMATVNAMVLEFGSKLVNIVAVIGPSVGPCCFTMEQDSARNFQAIHPDCVRNMDSRRPYVDIRLATRILLERGGLLPEHIHDDTVTHQPNLTLCTSCLPDSFFSHVRDGVNFGTQVGFLWIK
ncbi:purine nucleoside phosphorylase LACC1 [Pygocentrus nattereri]|uniref:Purine nucleoside phosphorylase LACC1 n=1 Tax=Pygocentrus nattereri TaxID=42514 RepID=A0A3B4E587_PYGNA|nr:purine nucleoside phosphorylase LACC1 [Pygocentrus nattereri]XP_037395556.1 purine nucleoside phosphorylase LACC1 [Pygocentrus nattereri]